MYVQTCICISGTLNSHTGTCMHMYICMYMYVHIFTVTMQSPGCFILYKHSCMYVKSFRYTYVCSLPNTSLSARTTDLCQELAGHSVQGLLGPGSEPVDGRVVDQARKVPAASLEDLSNGRHAEDDVQVAGTLLDEVGPHTLPGWLPPCLHCLISHLCTCMCMHMCSWEHVFIKKWVWQ